MARPSTERDTAKTLSSLVVKKIEQLAPSDFLFFSCTIANTIGTSFQNQRQGATNCLLYRVAIIKLQIFKGCWRENYRDYSSEIWYLHVSEHAKSNMEKKLLFSPDRWRCAVFQCLSTAHKQILSLSNSIKTRSH